jgi:hypothetical protein
MQVVVLIKHLNELVMYSHFLKARPEAHDFHNITSRWGYYYLEPYKNNGYT